MSKIKNILKGKFFVALSPKREKINKVIKYSFCFGLPLVGAILGSTLGIREYNKNKTPQTDVLVELTKDQVNRRVYLISNDNLTIPISVSLNKKATLHEELMDVYNLLKVDSKLSNEHLNGFISNDIKMNKMEIKDRTLYLDFSNNLLNEVSNQNKIIEALTLSFVGFDEIDNLEIFINGTKLNDMVSLFLPEKLDENYGINQDFYYTNSIVGKEKQIVFYSRTYSENHNYLVPVSVYVEKGNSINQTFVNATKVSQPVSSHLKKLEIYNGLEKTQDNEEHVYSITTSGLVSEECVNKELYELISLSYDLMNIEEKVSFVLDDEVVMVDGIYSEEDTKVSNIIINEIKL